MAKHQIIILTIIIFCSCGRHDIANIPDSFTKASETDTFKISLDKLVALVKESDLKNDTTIQNEFRFFFFQPLWLGQCEFYKVRYKDSSLVCKEFAKKSPDGSGQDTLLNSRTIKLSYRDFLMLEKLINHSMFWGLESLTDDPHYLDKEEYVYEAKRNKQDKFYPNLKKYHFVKRYAPSNGDFNNLGQWLRILGHKGDDKNGTGH